MDNRILTVFKEEKNGNREEVENVEVKLFEAGMYVYELHTSGHEYVTDELWAAFYKMLLDERLVPRIVLSNGSPGFDWIKGFVNPGNVYNVYRALEHGILGNISQQSCYISYDRLNKSYSERGGLF